MEIRWSKRALEARKHRRLQELKRLAGSWADDPRSTEDIISAIRAMRTTKTKHFARIEGIRLTDWTK